jgi:hypothetical protein
MYLAIAMFIAMLPVFVWAIFEAKDQALDDGTGR